MKIVCIFLPAFVSVAIRHKRIGFKSNADMLLSYGLWTILINFLNMILVTYVLRMNDVVSDALDSFSFAIKYIAVAVVIAFLMPYFFEIISKYFNVNFKVESNDEEK